MRWPSTQTINDKLNNPNGINNAIFDLLSKLNTTYEELKNVPTVIDSDIYGRYREYPDGTTQGRTLTSRVLRSAPVALTTGVSANVLSLPIPANSSWMLCPAIGFVDGAGTTHTSFIGGVSLTSAALPGTDTLAVPTNGQVRMSFIGIINFEMMLAFPAYRYDNTTNAEVTLYLVAQSSFAVSTCSAFGSLQAVSIL